MTPQDRYELAKRVFLEVCDLVEDARAEAIERLCGDDEVMRDEVESLLAHYFATEFGGDPDSDAMETTDLPNEGERPPRQRRRLREKKTERVGPYRVMHELGRGGMGVVYLGMKDGEEFRQQFAIKLLRRGLDTEDVLQRFELERKLLGAMNHPGIARLYDAGETDDGRPYFVMEFVEGIPLDRFADERRLNITERLDLFRKVCEAVHYAHQNLIVHRDLKPGNILVTNDGQPKLLDFGIAKLVNPAFQPVIKDPTAPEMRVMTPEYASPEQVRGDSISTASDVYALGVILYELLCGHRPYRITRRIREEIMRVVCEVEPERPSTAITKVEDDEQTEPNEGQPAPSRAATVTAESVSHSRGVPPTRLRRLLAGDLDNIVLMAMRKEPNRRYPSAQAFAEDIRRHLDGNPVVARPDTFGYRAAKFVRRNRITVSAASIVFAAIVVATIVSTTGWREANLQARAARIARNDAIAQRDRAQRRFDLVRGIATTMMYDVHDRVAPLDGSLPAREALVTRAEEYLDALAEESADDASLLAELADANDRVGEMRWGMRNPSQGDAGRARERYEKAMALRVQLAALEPQSASRRLALIDSHRGLGDLARGEGDMASSIEHGEAALVIARELMTEHPEGSARHADVRLELARCLADVGQAYRAVGRVIEMRDAYEESLAIRRIIVADDPSDALAMRSYTVLLNRVANMRVDAGDMQEGIALYEESLAIRRDLADRSPDSGRARRDIAVVEYLLAGVLFRAGRLDDATAHAEEALRLYTQRLADNPSDARSLRDRIYGLELVTGLALEGGAIAVARERADEARGSAEALLALNPESPEYRMIAARSDELIASVAIAGEDLDAAAEAMAAAVRVHRQLHVAHPDDLRFQQALAVALRTQSGVLRDSGQDLAGMRAAEEAREHFDALRAVYPDEPSLRDEHAAALLSLSQLLMRFDSIDEARVHANLAATIARDANADFLHDLARVLHETGETETARVTAARAIALLEQDDPRRSEIESEIRTW